MSNILQATNLSKQYRDTGDALTVFKNIDLNLEAGDMIAITGVSGAGKSTLLHLLGGLDAPSTGEVVLMGQSFTQVGETQKDRLRREHLGFVYQFHHLLPELNALENVMMPLVIAGYSTTSAKQKAADMLSAVNLSSRLVHRVGELSGGERQRVAIARALVKQPSCVLADEPTGNLDEGTAADVFALLHDLCKAQGSGMIVVTHNMSFAKQMDKVYELTAGQLVKQ